MEYTHMPEDNIVSKGSKANYINVRLRKPKAFTIVIGAVVILIFAGLFFAKGIFIAATVDGSPISRLSVIKELEKQGGKQALESIINKKLIENELNKQKITADKEEVDKEIKKIEAQVAGQGSTLASALAMQGMTEEKLREQITIQEKLKKVLADKIAVTDTEVDAYIKDNKMTPPKDMKLEDFRKQIRDQLTQQKFQQEAQKWVSSLIAGAKIKYYVKY